MIDSKKRWPQHLPGKLSPELWTSVSPSRSCCRQEASHSPPERERVISLLGLFFLHLKCRVGQTSGKVGGNVTVLLLQSQRGLTWLYCTYTPTTRQCSDSNCAAYCTLLQYKALLCSTMHCSSVQCTALQYNALLLKVIFHEHENL